MLAMFAVFLVVLLLFIGLGVDLGFAYITKAQLSKAVDAAALAGMSNFYLGSATASNIAAGTFVANFAPTNKPGYVATMPVPSITFGTDSASNETLTVSATATINTFFIRVLPQWRTLTVADTGKASRAKVIMTLVLDHSYSMDPSCSGSGCTGGGAYLPDAVANFINVFEDGVDSAAMVSFGSTSVTNVAMGTPFKSAITTAAAALQWTGGTFSHGGLSNALAINNSVVVPTNVNAIKVVVFFTDGQCNMIQSSYACPGATVQPWNIGGYQTNQSDVGFWLASDTNTCAAEECPNYGIPALSWSDLTMSCGNNTCSAPNLSSTCPSVTTFPSITGTNLSINSSNIVFESEARCIQVANQMRANGMYVYSIGLAVNSGSPDVPTVQFLQQVANDPALKAYAPSLYNPNAPPGQAVVADNGADLTQLFQQIAGDILLRLTY